jgi:hypothetical protein
LLGRRERSLVVTSGKHDIGAFSPEPNIAAAHCNHAATAHIPGMCAFFFDVRCFQVFVQKQRT